jgi:CheY-like chemotaxis protein
MRTSPTGRETKQILIVEDDEDSRRALTNVLEDEGFSVAALDSCEAALDYLQASPKPRLIVLDLMMPGMEGWDFRHRQKHDAQLAGIPVISVSAVGKLVDVEVALRKPLDYDELLRAVERYVTRRAHRGRALKARHSARSEATDHSLRRRK